MKKLEETRAINISKYGGEPFDPRFTQVDRILTQEEDKDAETGQKVAIYLVKWQGLSYAHTSWEYARVCVLLWCCVVLRICCLSFLLFY
jgi:hypothetical protein